MLKRSLHGIAWVLLVLTALVLWPQQWGGTMTYVITSGTSMQPMFTAGDLGVLRSAHDYRVGDVVAYRSEELGRVVMHRVRTQDDGVYTFQGDNNDFVDPDRVRQDQLLGRLVLRVPQVGPVLQWLLRPVNLLLVVGGLFLLLADRRREPDAQPRVSDAEPLVLDVSALQVPAGATVVQLVDPADLERLAARYDRPLLRQPDSGETWVVDGSTVYRHALPVEQAPEVGSGRDWRYDLDPDVVALLPRPRRQAAEPTHGVDLGRLLGLG